MGIKRVKFRQMSVAERTQFRKYLRPIPDLCPLTFLRRSFMFTLATAYIDESSLERSSRLFPDIYRPGLSLPASALHDYSWNYIGNL